MGSATHEHSGATLFPMDGPVTMAAVRVSGTRFSATGVSTWAMGASMPPYSRLP